MDPGAWHDRWTRAELAERIAALRVPKADDMARAIRNQSPHADTLEAIEGAEILTGRGGNYEAANYLHDAAECVRDDLSEGFCEHGHAFCNPTGSGKCSYECD